MKHTILGIVLIISTMSTLFFALAGIEIVFKISTLWGYLSMILVGGTLMSCGVSMAIHIKATYGGS